WTIILCYKVTVGKEKGETISHFLFICQLPYVATTKKKDSSLVLVSSKRKREKEASKMAGGSLAPVGVAKDRADQYQGRVTASVIIICVVGATGGSLFGYDIGISGGVTSMDGFLKPFFPTVYSKKNHVHQNNYCKYNNQGLAAFTSSLYLAGLVASLVASPVTRKYGRRASIICGGISFLVGATLNAAAINLAMLLLGRIMLGIGIGFGNQAVPLYLSEMAPTHLRGGLNMLFQLATTLGIFTANMINFGTQKLEPWGWRLSLGLAAVPAVLMTVGGILLPETPHSLIERGQMEKGRKILEKVRGTKNVNAEFQDLLDASELANSIEHPFRNILEKRNRPQLVMAIFMPTFQILTGINSILFYAPVLFQSMGFGGNASLYSSASTGAVLFSSTLISIATVDRLGRRFLLISGGIQMIICQIIVAIILGLKFGENQELSKTFSVLVVVVVCLFVLAFGWSWGPLGWTVPSEIFPLETRSAGQSITVAVNLLFTFIIAQSFLSLLCAFKFGIFLFFAGWVLVMTIFVCVFLPETKGVPIEEMILLWRRHWFWKKIVPGFPEVEESNNRKTNSVEMGGNNYS
ncbi:Sugar_tr domain-containing protein, partial [Cephalotus follicularis]